MNEHPTHSPTLDGPGQQNQDPRGLAVDLPVPPHAHPEQWLNAPQWGMIAFLVSEVAFFGTLVVTYLNFLGRPGSGPTPAILSLPLPIASSVCLLASSVTIHLALQPGRRGGFVGWWSATIALGVLFLLGTGYEWHELIYTHGLTISRNLFGTTYYTLVGFHALHVTIGVTLLSLMLGLYLAGHVPDSTSLGPELTAWYWHFVDAVWVVVFTVVYLVGR